MLRDWFKARTRDEKPAVPAEAPDWLPDAHFGGVSEVEEPAPEPDDDEDPDDELLDETPPEVVKMLGFDPALEDDGDDATVDEKDP